MNIFRSLSVVAESSVLYTCMPLLSVLKMFPGVSERLFSVSTFSSMLKSVQRCSGSFFELQLQLDFQQPYLAVSVSTLTSFESPVSLASLYAVALTVCLCGTNPAAQVHEYARPFYCFVFIIRKNVSV